VALDALDRQGARKRAAPAVLDHVAQRVDRGRFADDAVVERFATCLEGFDDGHGAIDGIAFFIGGEQEGERTGMVRVSGEEGFDGRHRSSDRGFHVGRAASVEHAVADFRGEGRAGPFFQRAGRHDIGVAGKDEERRRRATARPEIGDTVAVDVFDGEAECGEAFGNDCATAGIFRRDGRPGDDLPGQSQGWVGH